MLWIFGLAALGIVISGGFSGWLGLRRDSLVLVYLLLASPLIIAFFRRSWVSFHNHLRLPPGILTGLILGALLAVSVVKQPSSAAPSGPDLALALVWLGVVYGLLDAFLLTVLPVLAVFGGAIPRLSGAGGWRRGALALVASLIVTAAYHLGYEEFRGRPLAQPLVGNTIMTAGYLATGNIATPLIAHVVMHGAAVLHGMETTTQLPPHYGQVEE